MTIRHTKCYPIKTYQPWYCFRRQVWSIVIKSEKRKTKLATTNKEQKNNVKTEKLKNPNKTKTNIKKMKIHVKVIYISMQISIKQIRFLNSKHNNNIKYNEKF